MDKATVYLSLGTNLGNKEQNLLRAIEEIKERIGTVKAQSAFLATEPWGFESANSFLNAAVKVETTLLPLDLLHATQDIEHRLGRTQKSEDGVYHDRIIDIDILQYYPDISGLSRLSELSGHPESSGNEHLITDGDGLHYSSAELTLPHPLMNERDFVLIPLSEIK